MLGEGVRAAFEFLGFEHRTIAYVEREAAAAAQLVTLMETGALDPAPVWSDMLTFNGRDWRGKVDCIIAGFPCQDLSVAGRRAGLDGKRSGLFFRVLDIADDCDAGVLILENVRGITSATATVMDKAAASEITGRYYQPNGSRGGSGSGSSDDEIQEQDDRVLERAAARILGELADRGWNAEWIHVSASDVGASHGRERWFCLAWRRHDDAEPRNASADQLANPESQRCREARQCSNEGIPGTGQSGSELADASEPGCERGKQRGTCAGDRDGTQAHGPATELCSALPLFAPDPTDKRWAEIIEQYPGLAPAIESGVRLLADGMDLVVDESKSHQLRAIGNGVVPLSAAAALVTLIQRSRIAESG